jgi:hypothetical protein
MTQPGRIHPASRKAATRGAPQLRAEARGGHCRTTRAVFPAGGQSAATVPGGAGVIAPLTFRQTDPAVMTPAAGGGRIDDGQSVLTTQRRPAFDPPTQTAYRPHPPEAPVPALLLQNVWRTRQVPPPEQSALALQGAPAFVLSSTPLPRTLLGHFQTDYGQTRPPPPTLSTIRFG